MSRRWRGSGPNDMSRASSRPAASFGEKRLNRARGEHALVMSAAKVVARPRRVIGRYTRPVRGRIKPGGTGSATLGWRGRLDREPAGGQRLAVRVLGAAGGHERKDRRQRMHQGSKRRR